MKKTSLIGITVGSIFGIALEQVIGPSAWAIGGGITGGIIGFSSVDLAASVLYSGKAAMVTALVFALIFGFGPSITSVLRTGNIMIISQGIGPFLSIIIIYGIGCPVVASITGLLAYTTQEHVEFIHDGN
ncbi:MULTISPECIES: hypothetical protein [Halorubrum]|jgi:hypothetical protein|uniref:hypothetical protein n=1 Tax=Halorubrum TaxID=56688 RepID=UPI0011C451A4|nr:MULTISPECIES: hypothetical protein [Halorubrum]MDB2265385.1 hypothetical protein [Halorubrum ezzemoulense]